MFISTFKSQVMQLEKDSDALREVVDMDEGLIRELQIKVFDLENSEKALQRALETLEESEKTLKSSKEELEEENDKSVTFICSCSQKFGKFGSELIQLFFI